MTQAVHIGGCFEQAKGEAIRVWATLRGDIGRFAVLSLASYGLLYFSYKWYAPTDGDFVYEYYKMYVRPVDFSIADAPFIYRQFSAALSNMIYSSGIYYAPSGTHAV